MKHKKSIVSVMSAAAVVSVPMVASADDTADFNDLTQNHSGYDQVQSLVSKNIISGYQDGTFRPYDQVSREHVAVMLTRALDLDRPSNVAEVLSDYQDVDENSAYAEEIAAVTDAGIFNGDGGSFNPHEPTTRAQMATLLAEAYHIDADESDVDVADIDDIGDSHRDSARALIQHGIVNGAPGEDGYRYFNPHSNLSRAQFAIMLDKVMGETDDDADKSSEETTITAASGADLNGEAMIKADEAAYEADVATDKVADGANEIQLTIDDESFDKAQLEDGFELTVDNATYSAVPNDDGAWTINQSENDNADSEDAVGEEEGDSDDETDADAVNDQSAEKMNQLNIKEISVETEEFEANIEQDSGVYTSELEDANGETEGQEAFDQIYPMVEKLDLTPETSQEETLNQIFNAFNLDGNDANFEVEVSFHNTDDVLEFENEKAEDEEAEDADEDDSETDSEDAEDEEGDGDDETDADAVNDQSAEKMNQLNIKEINVEAAEFEANIEQNSGVYTSELESGNEETEGQEAFDQIYPMVEKLSLTPESSQEETLSQITSTFHLDENDENIEVEVSFHNSDDELDFENEKAGDEEADEEDEDEDEEDADDEDDSEEEDDDDEVENDNEDEDEDE